MANIKNFRIEHLPTFGEIEVEIDFGFSKKNKNNEFITVEHFMKEMVDFWTGSQVRLDENEGNYQNAFLKQLCSEVIILSASKNLSVSGIIDEINDKEGWYPIDGSCGIKLLSVIRANLGNQDDYEINEFK